VNAWLVILPAVVFGVTLFIRVARVAHNRFNELAEKLALKEIEHSDEKLHISAEFASQKTVLETANQMLHETITKLENSTTAKDIEVQRRKLTKDLLGVTLDGIEGRIRGIQMSDWSKWDDATFDKEFDDWSSWFGKVKECMELNLSKAEIAYFESTSDLIRTPVSEQGTLSDRARRHQWWLDMLKHRSSKIRTIIEKHL
jgi:hypothetical protein